MIGLIDLLAAAAAGLLATLVMDFPMARLPEGKTAPTVAAGVLTDTHPDKAPARVATLVHYGAGTGTGVLFLAVVTTLGQLFQPTLAYPLAGGLLVVVMVIFFILIPLPRAGGFSQHRLTQIKRDWVVLATVYALTVGVLHWLLVPEI